MLSQENESYVALFSQMVRTMVRLEVGHGSKLRYQYTEAQKGRLSNLVKYLRKDARENEEETASDVLAAYQSFCWSLVYSAGEATQKSWGNPIQRFIWLMALQDEGTFMQASDLTPLLAKLKYFCRLVTLYESLVYHDSTNMGEDAIG
jgi:hypothetical protein